MEIAHQDLKVQELKKKVELLEKFRRNHMHLLREANKENSVLSDVVKEYERNNDEIINVKKEQKIHLEKLLEYIQHFMKISELNETHKKRANYEISNLKNELKSLEQEIKEIEESR